MREDYALADNYIVREAGHHLPGPPHKGKMDMEMA